MDRGTSATRWMRAAALLLATAGCNGDEVTTSAPPPTASATSALTPAPPRARPAPPEAAANTPCDVVGKLSSARHNFTIAALSDGRVLFVGGGLQDDADPRAEVDAYDPKTSTVTPFAPLRVPRIKPGVAALADGRVVVVGGTRAYGQAIDTIEVYEPATKAFRVLETRLQPAVSGPFAIPMKDGRVLTGGGIVPSLEKAIVQWEMPLRSFVLDPTTGKLTRTRDTPWPLGTGSFYAIAESGAITVTGAGPVDSIGMPLHDCAAIFDPASRSWSDAKRCKAPPDSYLFRAMNGGPGTATYSEHGLSVYRNGKWEQLTMKVPSHEAGADLTAGISLDEQDAVAVDGTTHEVVSCSF